MNRSFWTISLVILCLLGGSTALASAPGGPGEPASPCADAPNDVRTIARRIASERTQLRSPVRNWYVAQDRPLIWRSPSSDASRAFRETLRKAEAEGLGGVDLQHDAILRDLDRLDLNAHSDSVVAEAEIALSSAFLRLAEVLLRGSDARDEQDVEWAMQRDSAPGLEVLAIAADRGPQVALDSVRPLLPLYDRTIRALASLRARLESGGEWPTIEQETVASLGDSMDVVAEVRSRLTESLVAEERELANGGAETPRLLDERLAGAISRFQLRHGLAVDSVIGPETITAMNVPLGDRIDQLRLNLDRIRWLPRDMGARAILVNIAGFELRVLENNAPVMDMGVVVGQPSWRTAVFGDTIEHLIVNPYWHVPESIEASETLPRVLENPAYLAANDISVVPSDNNFGEPVDPSSIDWSSVSAETMPYDFRQEPGPENALGQIKFMFPNQNNIYLHDTPADELFKQNFRAFSHGCIRVERPWDLAEYILRHNSDRRPGELAEIRASRERTRLELSDPLPVYIAYLTTWVHEDGTVSFHQDLYNRDQTEIAEASR